MRRGFRENRLQVNAFKAVFKRAEGTIESRFAEAIVLTNDERWAKKRDDPRMRRLLRKRGIA